MPNLNVNLNATLQVLDTTVNPNTYIVNRLLSLTFQATAQFYEPFFQVGAGATVVSLPGATARVVVVINKAASGSGNNITVSFTPTGGVAETVLLTPGDAFVYFQTATVTGGITALSLTGSSATSAEVLVAA